MRGPVRTGMPYLLPFALVVYHGLGGVVKGLECKCSGKRVDYRRGGFHIRPA